MLIKSVRNDWLHCKYSEISSRNGGIFPAPNVLKKRPLVFKLDCKQVKTETSALSRCSPASLPNSLMWTRDGLVQNKASVVAWATEPACEKNLGYNSKSSGMIFIR